MTTAVHHHHRSRRKATIVAIVWPTAGILSGLLATTVYTPLESLALGFGLGWFIASLVFIAMVWGHTRRLDAEQTRTHATEEDPGQQESDALLLIASVVSAGAVVSLMVASKNTHGIPAIGIAIVALLSVAGAWSLIHVLYMLAYARVYYAEPEGGIDFNTTDPPTYIDFAYLAFDLGMTYQVSDTSVSTSRLRRMILHHTLLSYVFGVVVLASVINLVAGLD